MNMKRMMSVALVAGMGVMGYMYLKKKNPNMMSDMKEAMQKMATNVAYKLDDMDM